MIDKADLDHILTHTGDLWEEVRGGRLFITGGTGFFGRWLLESFIHANQELNLKAHVAVLTRRPAAAKKALPHLMLNPAVTLLEGDVRNFEFPKQSYSHIIHAATEASEKLNREIPLLMLDTITEGTRHTLDFAKFCGAKKILLTSSGGIYGTQHPELTYIPEDYNGAPDPMHPKSAYGIGKRTAEFLCSQYARQFGLHISIARGFTFVGPYLPLDTHFAIGNFIHDGLNNQPIIIHGDGTPYRSYLYAADLAIWLWTILLRGESLRPYNVGSDEAISIEQLARLVAQQFEPVLDVKILGTRVEGRLPERYIPSIARAKSELGLEAWIPVQESLVRTIRYYRGLSL